MKYTPAQSNPFQRAVSLPMGALCLRAIQPSPLSIEPFISVSGSIALVNIGDIMPMFPDSCAETDVCTPAALSSDSWEKSSKLKSVAEVMPCASTERTRQVADSVGESVSFCQTVGPSAYNTAGFSLAAVPVQPVGTEKGLFWSPVSGAAAYQVDYIRETTCISVQTESAGHEHFGLPEGDWQWRVRVAGAEDWTNGNDLHIDAPAPEPQIWQGQIDGLDELFFSRKYDTWSENYLAQHAGIIGGWEGTGETAVLDGKNKIADIFNGLMAFPNLVALILLSGIVALETKSFLDRLHNGEVGE